jgi:hypothetical protein
MTIDLYTTAKDRGMFEGPGVWDSIKRMELVTVIQSISRTRLFPTVCLRAREL